MFNKIFKVLCLSFGIFLLVGCNEETGPNKTEFFLNEEATIDNYTISLNDVFTSNHFQDVTPENETYLTLEFKITNNSNEQQVLDSNKNFDFKINDKRYTDLNHNKTLTLEPNETVMYQVVYDVPEEDSYSLIFYSGVVSNNIRFTTK